MEPTDFKNVIVENIPPALFEDAEVAEVKQPLNSKRWKFLNENLWKVDEIQNLVSGILKMTSWPQQPRKGLSDFFQKLYF